jgi:hypothetical protein
MLNAGASADAPARGEFACASDSFGAAGTGTEKPISSDSLVLLGDDMLNLMLCGEVFVCANKKAPRETEKKNKSSTPV